MVPSSFLRVYEPLDEFPPPEREKWTAYISSGARRPSTVSYADVTFGASSTGMIHPLVAEHAFVKKVDGRWMVCPWRVRLRTLVGMLTFRNTLPDEVAEDFVPEEKTQQILDELERIRQDNPGMRSNIAASPWHVPVRWFVLFDDAERIMTEDTGPFRLRYETDLGSALQRVNRALEILRAAGMLEAVIGAVAQLAEWLEEFPADSLLELDYGSVANLFERADLEGDRSAGEVWSSLEALEVGDFVEAGRRYEDLVEWWARVQALETAN